MIDTRFAAVAQANEIDAAHQFAEKFGFAALVAVILLAGVIYILRLLATNWAKNNDLRTAADIRNNTELAEAQKLSYTKHVEVADAVMAAVQHLVKIEERNSKAVELIADESHQGLRLANNTEGRTQALHQAALRSLRIAAGLFSDRPEIKSQLDRIADDLERYEETHPPRR